jgi:hypothetical protein
MTARTRLVAALVLVISVPACSKGNHQSRAPLAQAAQLGMAAGVDPRNPARVLPIGPVVTPVHVPSVTQIGRAVTVVFQVRPDTSCQMHMAYASDGNQIVLPPKVANDDGLISWTWVPVRHGKVETRVVCSGGQFGQATVRVL